MKRLALGIGGTISLLVGSLMVTREVPGVRVGFGVIVPAVLSLAAIVLFLGRLGLAAQRLRTTTGSEGLLGERGTTLSAISPDTPGQVRVHGEIWRAVSRVPIEVGRSVRATAVDGLTLVVEPETPDAPASGGGAP